MNKMSRKAFLILILISFFLMWGLPLKLWATTYRVHDGGDNLDLTPIDPGGGWTLTGAAIVQNETAEGTAHAIKIDAGAASSFKYSNAGSGSNWTPYAAYYMAMWIYSNDSSGTDALSIAITEEDDDNLDGLGPGIPQVWTAPISLTWTGWGYYSVQLPNGTTVNDFTPNPNSDPITASANFNPAPVPAVPGPGWAARGVTKIEMTLANNSDNNPSIYVDRIALSPGAAMVDQIFPTDDVQVNGKTTPDIVLDRGPYTISAVLSGADDVTKALNRISIIYSNDSVTLLNTNAVTNNDGVHGLFATPDSPPLSSSQPYTVFIMPVDNNGDTGQAEVITFKVSPPSKKVGTEYNRNATE